MHKIRVASMLRFRYRTLVAEADDKRQPGTILKTRCKNENISLNNNTKPYGHTKRIRANGTVAACCCLLCVDVDWWPNENRETVN